MSRYVLALGLLAGCAAPPALTDGAPVPSPEAHSVSLAPLAPVQSPTLPPALRASGPSAVTPEAAPAHGAHGALASGAMNHAVMGHGQMDHAAPEAPTAFADALGAYLAIQRALSRDAFDGVAAHALAFADAWAFATDEAPEADPHFWHMRAEAVDAVALHARALADAADLDAARVAFGHLSAPFADLVDAHGTPEADLSRFTCGMRSDLPGGGVWLQRGAETQNPYFGGAMLACGSRTGAVPSRAPDLSVHTPEASGARRDMEHSVHETMADH